MDNELKNINIIQISIICAQYNASFERIKLTLNSLLHQKDIEMQIVVTDDGSQINHFSEIENYFRSKGFNNYVLTKLFNNSGTVYNFLNGLEKVKYDIVKPISPGDMIFGEHTLHDWAESMINNKSQWSIAKAVNYVNENDEIKCIKLPAHPKFINCYLQNDRKKCILNYVLFNDISLGASTIAYVEILKKYIKEISDKVKYAEDNIYRIMMFDGVVGDFYNKNALIYEYGTGVSTQVNNQFKKQLNEDWHATDFIIWNRKGNLSLFQKCIKMFYKLTYNNNLFSKIIRKLVCNGCLIKIFNVFSNTNYTDIVDIKGYFNE